MHIAQKTTKETYQIEVMGYLDTKWEDWFDGFDIAHQDTGVTLLSGTVEDQSALHGLLAKVRYLCCLSTESIRRYRVDKENVSH